VVQLDLMKTMGLSEDEFFNTRNQGADKTTGVVLDRGSDPQGERYGWAESIEQGSMPLS